MSPSPSFREACLSGDVRIGTFVGIPHPAAVEVTALGRPDFICLDGEHAQIGRGEFENLIRAGEVHGVPVMARVPGRAPEAIAGVLDAGAAGIMVPMVSSAEEARTVVSASRYPPHGRRGVGPGRAAGYGYRIPDYLERANRSVLVAIQIENMEGLAEIDAIAAVEGIDVIFIGPGDLGVALSASDDPGKPSLEEAISRIAAACAAHGRVCGIFRPGPADISRHVEAGMRFFIMASDAMVLTAGVAQGITAAREALAKGAAGDAKII
jgi:4-hydroxy-2-oxoheptanedioate aldolase